MIEIDRIIEKEKEIIAENLISIYEYFHPTQKQLILLSVSCLALLTPFSDTMYLPALPSITSSLHTTDTLASLTISTYLVAVGIGQICWGPLTDHYGRTRIIYFGIVLFLIFSIGCMLSDSITTLIVLRSCQGLIVGSTLIAGQAVVNDIFPIEEVGTATGKFMVAILIGPIIAPLIGGALAQQFGWRSTFLLLAIMTVPFFFLAVFVVPETHPWFLVQNIEKQNESQKHLNSKEESKKIVNIIEKKDILRPPLVSPLETFLLIFDPQISIFLATQVTIFAIIFVSLTLLPLKLAESPYNMSESIVGITYVASGAGILLGSLLGGASSDRSAAEYPQILEARVTSSILPLFIACFAGIAFGYTLEAGIFIVVPLIFQFILGFGHSFLMTATMGYLTSCYPQNGGGIVSLMFSLSFLMSAILIAISVSVSDAIGMGNFFVLLCGINIILACFLSYRIYSKIRNGIIKLPPTEKEIELDNNIQNFDPNSYEESV